MYLNLSPKHSVVDALEESHSLEGRWNELITPMMKVKKMVELIIGRVIKRNLVSRVAPSMDADS